MERSQEETKNRHTFEIVHRLRTRRVTLWLGQGTEGARRSVRQFVAISQVPVVCGLASRGVVSERDALFVGHTDVEAASGFVYLLDHLIDDLLVLGELSASSRGVH